MNALKTLYSETYEGFGNTPEYKRYERSVESAADKEKQFESVEELAHVVNAECLNAFKAGFNVAVELLMGGSCNE